MSHETQTVTFEVSARDALLREKLALEATLTKRNERIAELEARLEAGEESEYVAKARAEGVREGWQACAQSVMNAASSAERELSNLRERGWKVYLEGEKR